jgi:hypothetical protein
MSLIGMYHVSLKDISFMGPTILTACLLRQTKQQVSEQRSIPNGSAG